MRKRDGHQAGPTILIDTLMKMTATEGHAACSAPAPPFHAAERGVRQRHVYCPRDCSSVQDFEALHGPDLALEDPQLFNQVALREPAQRAVEDLGVDLLFTVSHNLLHDVSVHAPASGPPTISAGLQASSDAARAVFREHANGIVTCNPFAGMAWAAVQRLAHEARGSVSMPRAPPGELSETSGAFETPTPPPTPPGEHHHASEGEDRTATSAQTAATRAGSQVHKAAADVGGQCTGLQRAADTPHPHPQRRTRARIRLVGSGPGDAALLTLAARDAIMHADVVVSDRLVPKEITALASGTVFVARKTPGRAHLAQAELDEAVLAAARQGKDVVRLKGGDSFVFGRGGEEIRLYRQHGFEPEVIPGISCCLAAPAAAKIPLTLRGTAHFFLVTTAHGKDGSTPVLPPYLPQCTFVFLMGVGRLALLRKGLLEGSGFPSDLPVAIVQEASRLTQRVVHTSLGAMVAAARANSVQAPATLIMGAVAEKWEGPVASTHLHALAT